MYTNIYVYINIYLYIHKYMYICIYVCYAHTPISKSYVWVFAYFLCFLQYIYNISLMLLVFVYFFTNNRSRRGRSNQSKFVNLGSRRFVCISIHTYFTHTHYSDDVTHKHTHTHNLDNFSLSFSLSLSHTHTCVHLSTDEFLNMQKNIVE